MFQNDEIIDEKYKILKSLGVGERAKIFLVLNAKTKEKNVLKVFSDLNNQDNIQRVNLTKMIDLVEIVDINGFGKSGGKNYYTMPYKPCRSLYGTINTNSKIPVIKTSKEINYILSFFRNIISHLVRNKLCWQFHPRHLMILETGKMFMTGLAYPLDDQKGVHFPDLTLGLMDECFPPELLRDNYCNPESYYQYTVAAILLSLLTGQLYSERNEEKMLSKIPKFNKTKRALIKALNINAQNRYQSFDEFYNHAKINSIFAFF